MVKEKSANTKDVISITAEEIGQPIALATIISPNNEPVEVTGEVDEAMRYALDLNLKDVELSSAEEKKLVRKMDLYLMPLICLLYAVQFMDKSTNSYASVMGLRTDLNMHGTMYAWVGSSFYFGYLVFVYPVSFFLQKFPLAKATTVTILLWSVVILLHATPNYAGFVFLRVTLGAIESAVTPAIMVIVSQWYRKEEQFLRTCYWVASNGFGIILGSSIAYGLAIRATSYSIESWKVLYLVTGSITFFIGIVFYFHIPDTPMEAWFLSDKEKAQVIKRIKSNNQGFGSKTFKKKQLIEAVVDYRTWVFFLFGFCQSIPSGGLGNFASILLSSDFGYTSRQALYMNMPSGAVEIVGCILFGVFHKYFKSRLLIASFSQAVALMASCLLAFAHEKKTRLAGYYLVTIAPVGMICCLSCFSSNVAGHTKKFAVSAIYLIGYSVGNIVGPYTFKASQAPHYQGAKVAIVVNYCAALIFMIILYFSYSQDNKRRDKNQHNIEENMTKVENLEFADLTDLENPNFRYAV